MSARKPSRRQLEAALDTLAQVTEWADLSGRNRDEIGSVRFLLTQILDGKIDPAREGTP